MQKSSSTVYKPKSVKVYLTKLLFTCTLVFPLVLVGCSKSDDDAEIVEEELEPTAYDFVVAADGTGDFTTVQEAFDAVPNFSRERVVIYIKKGTYKEVLTLPKNKVNVTIIGESASEVILTFDNYASKINPDTGEAYGTSGSSSSFIYGEGFYAKDITFENSAGPVGQALAIYIGGDKAVFVNCRFLGYQDTMYGGRVRQYFKNCYIEGSTDFIFGPSTAFFDQCQLHTKGGSAITAASTEPYVNYGYVFKDCTITGTGKHITTLGRPWRPYAAVAFINCKMSDAIKPEGWNNWGNTDNESTARYVEYKNTGEGAAPNKRVAWAKQLAAEEAAEYTITNVLKTVYADTPTKIVDNWDPTLVIEETEAFLAKLTDQE